MDRMRRVQRLDDNGVPLWRHPSTNNELRADWNDGWMDVNGWKPVLVEELVAEKGLGK